MKFNRVSLLLLLTAIIALAPHKEVRAEEPNSTQDVLLKEWSYVPIEIIESFIEDGWQVQLVDNCDDLYGDKLGLYEIQAVTDSRVKTIFINDNVKAIKSSLIHEVGHYVDWKLNFISNTTEFNRVYDSERKCFQCTTQGNSQCYVISTPMEYFAETFQQVIHKDSGLPYKCPDSYGFVGSIAFNFNEWR